jgi:hypothetical protein
MNDVWVIGRGQGTRVEAGRAVWRRRRLPVPAASRRRADCARLPNGCPQVAHTATLQAWTPHPPACWLQGGILRGPPPKDPPRSAHEQTTHAARQAGRTSRPAQPLAAAARPPRPPARPRHDRPRAECLACHMTRARLAGATQPRRQADRRPRAPSPGAWRPLCPPRQPWGWQASRGAGPRCRRRPRSHGIASVCGFECAVRLIQVIQCQARRVEGRARAAAPKDLFVRVVAASAGRPSHRHSAGSRPGPLEAASLRRRRPAGLHAAGAGRAARPRARPRAHTARARRRPPLRRPGGGRAGGGRRAHSSALRSRAGAWRERKLERRWPRILASPVGGRQRAGREGAEQKRGLVAAAPCTRARARGPAHRL